MQHLFKQINTELVDALKFSNSKTINTVNLLMGKLQKEIIERKYVHTYKKHLNLSIIQQKILICIETFGEIPYDINFLDIGFLRWCNINDYAPDNKKYYNSLYDNFIFYTNREPDTIEDIEKFQELDSDTWMFIYIKNHLGTNKYNEVKQLIKNYDNNRRSNLL